MLLTSPPPPTVVAATAMAIHNLPAQQRAQIAAFMSQRTQRPKMVKPCASATISAPAQILKCFLVGVTLKAQEIDL